MNSEARQILEAVKAGSMSIDDAMLEIKKEPFEDIGYAKVDLHRKIRQGAAEVIYGAGKTPEQMIGIVSAMLKNGQDHILITRLSSEAADTISQVHPLHYHKMQELALSEKCQNQLERERLLWRQAEHLTFL